MFLSFLSTWFPAFGMGGAVLLSLCILITAQAYTGRDGERYSVFNHYISELGEVGVSRLSTVFNVGIFFSGIFFLLFIIGLGLALDSIWARLGLAAGVLASVTCSLVGVFPMNHMKQHVWAAMTYFRSGLVTVLLFGIAILVQPSPARVHPLANLAGLLAIICYGAFLIDARVQSKKSGDSSLDPEHAPKRPRFWPVVMLEWAIFFSTVIWFFSIAFAVQSL